jgi:ABC-type transport system involved in multi-copper enzyme maturation permease subunit
MIGVFLLTLHELAARKIVIALFVVITIVWGALALALRLDVVEGTLAGVRILGQQADVDQTRVDPETGERVETLISLELFVVQVQSVVAGACYWLGILLALFATAPTIGHLLERGRVDLLLSKPIGRLSILGGHVGAVLFTVALMGVYLFGAVWLVMALKSDIWNGRFLLSLFVVMGAFAAMYGVVVFVGVSMQNTAIALMATYGLIFLSLILALRDQLLPIMNRTGRTIFEAAYHVLPNFAEVTPIVVQLSGNEAVADTYPLISTLLFGVVVYAAAGVVFLRRDY